MRLPPAWFIICSLGFLAISSCSADDAAPSTGSSRGTTVTPHTLEGGVRTASTNGVDFSITADTSDKGLSFSVEARNGGADALLVVGPCSGWYVDFGLEERISDAPSVLEVAFWKAVERASGGPYSSAWQSDYPISCPGLDAEGIDSGSATSWSRDLQEQGGDGEVAEAEVRFDVGVDDGTTDVDITIEAAKLPRAVLTVPVMVSTPALVADSFDMLSLLASDEDIAEWFDSRGDNAVDMASIWEDGSRWVFASSGAGMGDNIEVVMDSDSMAVVSVSYPSRISRKPSS